MIKLLIKTYVKDKRKNLNNLIDSMFLLKILSQLTKKGNKNLSYFILINILFKLKKNKVILPRLILTYFLNKSKPYVLLLNKRKGTLIFELPRFITMEQSVRKAVEWLVKVSKKSKRNIIKSVLLELKNISLNKSDVLKKNLQIIEIIKKNKPFFYLLKKKR